MPVITPYELFFAWFISLLADIRDTEEYIIIPYKGEASTYTHMLKLNTKVVKESDRKWQKESQSMHIQIARATKLRPFRKK